MRTMTRLSLLTLLLATLCACGDDDDTGDAGGRADSSVPSSSCRGTPSACSLLSRVQCDFASGCIPSGTCSGVVRACSTHASSGTCNSQSNCFWSSGSCQTGAAVQCGTWATQSFCESYDGCYFNHTCEGVAFDCDILPTASSCLNQPGCRWE